MRWRTIAGLAVALAVLTLAGIGAVGSYRWARAKLGPEPPQPPPVKAEPVNPDMPTRAEAPPTRVLQPTREELLGMARKYGLDLAPAKGGGAPRAAAAPTAGGSGATVPGWLTSALAGGPPWFLADVTAEIPPRAKSVQTLCWIPCEGCAAEVRHAWTVGDVTLAEAAGCAAADAAEKAEEVAAKVDAKLERVLGFKLDAELRAELRAGIGYGSGGPGALLMGSLGGFQTGPVNWRADGVAWISADPAIAVALTGGTTWAPGDKR